MLMFDFAETYFGDKLYLYVGIIGVSQGLVCNLVIYINQVWAVFNGSMYFNMTLNALSHGVGVVSFLLGISKSDDLELAYFSAYFISLQVIHLLIFDVFPFVQILFLKKKFAKMWDRRKLEEIENFRKSRVNIGDFGSVLDAEFEQFRKGLMVNEQLLHNQTMLEAKNSIPEFFGVFFMFVLFYYCAVFYPIPCLSFIIFLVLKNYLYIKKSIVCYRRPLDKPNEKVIAINQYVGFVMHSAPVYFSLLLIMKTRFLDELELVVKALSLFAEGEKSIFGASNTSIITFVAFEHLLLFLHILILLIYSPKDSWTGRVLRLEQIRRKQHFEQLHSKRDGDPLSERDHVNNPDEAVQNENKAGDTTERLRAIHRRLDLERLYLTQGSTTLLAYVISRCLDAIQQDPSLGPVQYKKQTNSFFVDLTQQLKAEASKTQLQSLLKHDASRASTANPQGKFSLQLSLYIS